MNNELLLANKKKISNENVIDTIELARNKFPGSGVSLDALCKKFRIDNSRRKKHTAILDCEILSKVYINLIGQKEPVFQFENKIQKEKITTQKIKNYSKKIISVSNKEIDDHKKFLKTNLKKNFF